MTIRRVLSLAILALIAVLVSAGVVIALFLGGIVYFKHMERTFADVV